MSDKIIVSNFGQLSKKYGGGVAAIRKALRDLVKADKARGLVTKIVGLDDPAQMKKLKAPPVKKAGNARENKRAIDGIYKTLQPDYLMILGAIDVVPHQPMTNPKPTDGDKYAWGDLPYACEAPYGRDPAKFRAPTRVVGRLPDVVGSDDPSYVVGLLRAASSYRSRPAADYQGYFGVSAEVWKSSTSLSLRNMFGSSGDLHLSPPRGPKWTKAQLKKLAHFINCHGAEADPNYYGQKGSSYPVAHSASHVAGRIAAGTVAAAECCYGAELYSSEGSAGICNAYLGSGAYGFFGSTTIAYGPAAGNGAADLITQYFLKHVLSGASTGRATLQARQDFVHDAGTLNPVDLKTLAQFHLLGDPSVHPVEKPETHSKSADAALTKGVAKTLLDFGAHRTNRRRQLIAHGRALAGAVAYAHRLAKSQVGKGVSEALRRMARNLKMKEFDMASFDILGGSLPKAAFGKAMPTRRYHLLEGASGPAKNGVTPTIVLVAEEQNGKMVSVREYHRR